MQSERTARRVGADLQHVGGRYGKRRPAAVIERVVVRDEHAQGIIAAAQVQHDAGARVAALRPGEIRQELGRGEGHRERRDAALDELSPGDLHTNWYSGDPAMRWTRPGA